MPLNQNVDESVWEKAKKAVDKSYKRNEKAYWPTVQKVYKQMKKKQHRKALKNTIKAPMPMYLHQGPY